MSGVDQDEVAYVTAEISRRIGYVDISVAGRDASPPYRCAEVVRAQAAGEDPTAPWRAAVAADQAASAGRPVPPQVAAAFVLQWYLGVVAVPLAWAAVLGPWVLDGDPGALAYDLAEPSYFPCAIEVAATGVEVVTEESARWERARARYEQHARAFADTYRPPEVRVGSGQRRGMVEDAWTMALQDAQAALLPAARRPARRSRRRACCFIYALPGAVACAACPRHGRAGA